MAKKFEDYIPSDERGIFGLFEECEENEIGEKIIENLDSYLDTYLESKIESDDTWNDVSFVLEQASDLFDSIEEYQDRDNRKELAEKLDDIGSNMVELAKRLKEE